MLKHAQTCFSALWLQPPHNHFIDNGEATELYIFHLRRIYQYSYLEALPARSIDLSSFPEVDRQLCADIIMGSDLT